ncbi:MAG: LamG domain-containing protein, partial [Byssovorax sp.]
EAETVLGYSLFLSNGTLGFQMANGLGSDVCSTSAISSCTNYISTSLVADGLWHHVAVTVTRSSPTGGTFYVDGCPVFTFNPTFRPGDLTNTSMLTFGRRSWLPSGFFAGAVDEFHLYNRALTQAEVMSLGSSVGAGMCNGPF